MDVLHRLKNTVSNALPGNPVTKEFEIHGHRASGGPGMIWKIYNATQRTTKQCASVFMLEKKCLDRYSKRDKEIIIETLKKGVSQLTRLRHPKVLSVLHPLEESRESLAFATEPVFASLANILGCHDNMINPLPADLADFKLFDVEIKYGLLQLTEGLCFLHNDAKMVHGNLCPSSIILNNKCAWKIAGFDFCIQNANQQDQAAFYPFREWSPGIPPIAQPSLDYLAPEHVLTMSYDTASDMFAFGILFFTIFNNGKPLFECRNQLTIFKKNAQELRSMKITLLGRLPEEVRDHVKMLLNAEPSVRPDADQMSKIAFFGDVGAMTLQYLDSLFQRDNLQKSQFFKGLSQVIAKMPKRVCLQRILPCLAKECANKEMIPFILPNIMNIAELASPKEFAELILQYLIPLFKIQEPIQITYIFMQNMNLLLSKTPQQDIKIHVLPMICRTMELGAPQIQELCLNIIPNFASLIDYTAMKNAIIPRIRKLCLTTTSLNLRVNGLVCIGKLLEYMDKWFVLDEILPILQEIPSREPAVLMSILGIYQVILTHKKLGMTKDVLATKVLPFIIPLALDNNLNLNQFNAYMEIIKDMMGRMETEHKRKLEQLNSMHHEQRTLQLSQEPTQNSDATGPEKPTTMMGKFMSDIGMARFFSSGDVTQHDNSKIESNPAPASLAKQEPIPVIPKYDSSTVIPKFDNPGLPNRPAKPTLTMEEKQRLAKEQEQLQRYKNQDSLTPRQTEPHKSTTQVKDLTKSLLDSDFMGAQKKSIQPTPGFTSTGMMTGVNKPPGGVFGTSSTMMSNGFPAQKPPTKINADYSSLEQLFQPMGQPKQSLSQMTQVTQSRPRQPTAMTYGMQPPGMMGNQNMTGMMPMSGGQSMMGNRGIPGMTQQGNMGNPRMMGDIGMPSISTPSYMPTSAAIVTANHSQPSPSSQLSNKDIADLLG